MDRRTFMSWVGLGLLANSLPVAIAASVEAKPRADGFVSVGTLKQLQSDGVIQVPKFAAGPLLVIRNPQDSKKLEIRLKTSKKAVIRRRMTAQ
jgi:cytochrome b6-f complex iron-sulfur subunit